MWSSLVHLSFPEPLSFSRLFAQHLGAGIRGVSRRFSLYRRRRVGKGWWKVVVRIGGGFSGVASPRGECEWMAGVGHDTERAEDTEPSSLRYPDSNAVNMQILSSPIYSRILLFLLKYPSPISSSLEMFARLNDSNAPFPIRFFVFSLRDPIDRGSYDIGRVIFRKVLFSFCFNFSDFLETFFSFFWIWYRMLNG